jgi:hypothetical protein
VGGSTRDSGCAGKFGSCGRVRKILSRGGVLTLLAFGSSVPLFAQVEMPVERDSASIGKLSITGYPYIFYSPETEFAVGGALILSRRLGENPAVKPSNMMLSGYYSAKGSYDVFLNPEFFLGDDKYYLGITLDYWRFVDKFWGVGNQTVDTGEVGYIRKIILLNVEFDVAVAGPLKVGLNVDFNRTHIEDKQLNPYLASGEVTGSDGGFTSGFGLVLFADTRNGAFYPTKGGYYKLALLNTFHWMGSQFKFVRWILDLRQYISLTDRMVLAAQFYASGIGGDPPFYFLPALGGDNVERGYYEGRYRDKIYAAIQGELRLRLTRRWGLVGWIGTGDVSAGLSSFKLAQFKPSFGLGVRFALDPQEILNVRADFARGRETKGMYFNAKEAF